MTGVHEQVTERLYADVAVIGYGPVGRLLALLLGRSGKRVIVVERQPRAYPLPRAVHFDDEIGRIFQSVGVPPDSAPDVIAPYDDLYEWRAADRQPLLRLDWRGLGPSGWHVSHFFYQPDMEAILDAQVQELETVRVLRGWQGVTHAEDADGVTMELQSATDERRTVTARYVVGADGANSLVRSWIGSTVTDLGYFHDWLVIDLLMHAPLEGFDFSPAAWQLCDPTRPTTLVPGGPGRRRFEFMRLPTETVEELNDEGTAWRLLEPWGITPDVAELERHAVYTFQARWCDTWRKGRLLLAGDSAHLMPPFAGQGMCSGLRDAVALAWRLELVLDGRADDAILDSYGPERAEHVRHFIEASMALGELICLPDPVAAAERDTAMKADLAAGVQQPPRPLPRLGAGLHRDDNGGGLLSIQAEVDGGMRRGLFDDVVGPGGVLLLAEPRLSERLSSQDIALLTDLGWKVVALAAKPGQGQVVDTTGAYTAWLADLGAVAVLVRPDLYLYGVATDIADLTALLEHLCGALRAPDALSDEHPVCRAVRGKEDSGLHLVELTVHRDRQHPDPVVPLVSEGALMSTDSDTTAEPTAAGWTRPELPPEGAKNFLDEHPFDLVQTPLPAGIVVEQVRIPMRDAVELAATVFRPEGGDAVPAIATATPYGKDNYQQWHNFRDAPEGNVPGGGFYLGHVEVSDHTAFEAPDPGYWVPIGYAVVLVDLPGLGASGSNTEKSPGPEARWWDTLAWLAEQPWCTGNVGMSGVSALCATQWIAGKDPAPPQLKAIIPWEGINETGPAGGYGGIPETVFPAWIGQVWVGPNINHDAAGPEPFLFDWAYDTAAIRVPALVCASFSDQELHTWDTFDAFTRLRSEHKWLYNHGRQKWGAFYGADELALQKRFLDRFCKGDTTAMDGVPTVRLEVNQDRFTYKVLTADAWPVPGTDYRPFYLDATGGTLTIDPAQQDCTAEFAPAPVDDTTNRAVFDHTFTEDTDLVGHMALRLFLEGVDTDDVDLFVGIEKLDPDGNEVYFFSASGGNANGPVTRGWLRASKRALDTERSTEWRPVRDYTVDQPLQPGEIAEVDIPLMPSGTTFRAGETLRLVVQSWSTPGQWEGGETRRWGAVQTGRARLHTGPRHQARLLVPVLGSTP